MKKNVQLNLVGDNLSVALLVPCALNTPFTAAFQGSGSPSPRRTPAVEVTGPRWPAGQSKHWHRDDDHLHKQSEYHFLSTRCR